MSALSSSKGREGNDREHTAGMVGQRWRARKHPGHRAQGARWVSSPAPRGEGFPYCAMVLLKPNLILFSLHEGGGTPDKGKNTSCSLEKVSEPIRDLQQCNETKGGSDK